MTVSFAWLIWQWYYLHTASKQTVEEMFSKSVKAYQHIKKISEAQQKYIKKDWDGDGQKNYAKFYVHLWQSVDGQGAPINVNYISKELGFAMGPTKAIDGYYFLDVREYLTPKNAKHSLDYTKEWMILSAPVVDVFQKPTTFFLADHSGRIYAKKMKYLPRLEIPLNPLSDGWVKIKGVDDLRSIPSG